ncbi:unnamed protein product [Caenorhabditis auriculariae]|uniref:Uncharacterized protein n=1 Tax=Caenorhabditis auriculariae TaxID=2777116 RepID=A0A8S1GQC9_9PELO|nr:unnamed protein product [Caenorhabditis auriculariae]
MHFRLFLLLAVFVAAYQAAPISSTVALTSSEEDSVEGSGLSGETFESEESEESSGDLDSEETSESEEDGSIEIEGTIIIENSKELYTFVPIPGEDGQDDDLNVSKEQNANEDEEEEEDK